MSAWVWCSPLLCHTNSFVWKCLWLTLVLHGQTELCPDCVHFSCFFLTASTSATVPWLHLLQLASPWLCWLQLLLPDCILLSCCSSSASACYHAHTVQCCSPTPQTSHLQYAHTHRHTFKILIYCDNIFGTTKAYRQSVLWQSSTWSIDSAHLFHFRDASVSDEQSLSLLVFDLCFPPLHNRRYRALNLPCFYSTICMRSIHN